MFIFYEFHFGLFVDFPADWYCHNIVDTSKVLPKKKMLVVKGIRKQNDLIAIGSFGCTPFLHPPLCIWI